VPRFDTQEVFNQSPPYENIDLFSSDAPLKEAVKGKRRGVRKLPALAAFGRQWGTAEMFALARRANENPPKLYGPSMPRAFAATSSNFTRPITI
jgi:putative acyl-CoA dehydrogenase